MKTTSSEHVVYTNCFCIDNSNNLSMYTACSELVVFMYWTRSSMNNLLTYFGLADARISASEKVLPVPFTSYVQCDNLNLIPMNTNISQERFNFYLYFFDKIDYPKLR